MYVLQCGKYNHIVNWKVDSEHNEQHFVVQDIDDFTKQVLPSFFKVAKYESFQRKLYRWGFIKTRRSRAEKMKAPKSVCYVHPCFRQGNYSSAAQMTCSGASMEISKSTQKHRKRQQRQKESMASSSKRQRNTGFTVAKKEVLDSNKKILQVQKKKVMTINEQQPVVIVPSMQNKTATASMPGLNKQMQHSILATFPQTLNMNMFTMMNPCLSSRNDTIASNTIIRGNESIQDDSFALISGDGSTLNSNASSSCVDETLTRKQDERQLLARARTQRQINRIQMNSLMKEQMLQELDSSMEDVLLECSGTNLDTSTVAGMNTHVNPSSLGISTQALQASSFDTNVNGNLSQVNQAIGAAPIIMNVDGNNGRNNTTTMDYISMSQQILDDAFNALMT